MEAAQLASSNSNRRSFALLFKQPKFSSNAAAFCFLKKKMGTGVPLTKKQIGNGRFHAPGLCARPGSSTFQPRNLYLTELLWFPQL